VRIWVVLSRRGRQRSGQAAPLSLALGTEPDGFWFWLLACILASLLLTAVSFWRKGYTLGFAAACIWFFENWFNIARYMADARKLELPLVGGGDHDWNTIFTRWDVLLYDTRIAAAVRLIGWIGITATCAWVLWRAWSDRRRADIPSRSKLRSVLKLTHWTSLRRLVGTEVQMNTEREHAGPMIADSQSPIAKGHEPSPMRLGDLGARSGQGTCKSPPRALCVRNSLRSFTLS